MVGSYSEWVNSDLFCKEPNALGGGCFSKVQRAGKREARIRNQH